MAAREPLKAYSYIERNGRIEEFNGYTEEEEAAVLKELSRMSTQYFALHPDEYAKL